MNGPSLTLWQRFWHKPVRAERLAVARVALALVAIVDQLVNYLPNISYFYGPAGIAPAGFHDAWLLGGWRWTILVFSTDDLTVVWTLFWIRLAVTAAFLVGWRTRLMTVLLYFLTLCFLNRNVLLRNGGDTFLVVVLFLMMFAPSGEAFSLDCRRRRKILSAPATPIFIPAWPLRLLQIQLCMVYLTTGLAKLVRSDPPFTGSWWDGTSLHYVLNDFTLTRWSYAQLPLHPWLTVPLTYLVLAWEILFTPLVIFRRTRWLALGFGILFHLGIFLTMEIGFFSFYFLALYVIWIPDERWPSLGHRLQ